MTQKELSYLEDAINHEKSIIKILEETNKNIENQDLISFLEQELQNHTQVKEELIEILEVKSNA